MRVHSRNQNVISFNNKSTVLYIFYMGREKKWALALFLKTIAGENKRRGKSLVEDPLDGTPPGNPQDEIELRFDWPIKS